MRLTQHEQIPSQTPRRSLKGLNRDLPESSLVSRRMKIRFCLPKRILGDDVHRVLLPRSSASGWHFGSGLFLDGTCQGASCSRPCETHHIHNNFMRCAGARNTEVTVVIEAVASVRSLTEWLFSYGEYIITDSNNTAECTTRPRS